MYYNRARYYDQNIGRFNRMDPFSGNNRDPQSLHKYLYAHCNPINSIDPTGEFGFSIAGLTFNISMQTVMRTIDVGRSYLQYSKAKSALNAIAVGSVIASSFVNNYIGGAAELELPFGNHPMLKKWPNVKFALEGSVLSLSVDFVQQEESPSGDPRDLTAGGSGSFNFETGKFEGFSVNTSLSIKVYKKGPIAASISGKFEIPPAFKLGIGLSFSSGWDPLSWAADFSLLKADKSGLSVLWGIGWKN